MPQAPWKIRISADGAGTLAAVHATVELVNRAAFDVNPCIDVAGDYISLDGATWDPMPGQTLASGDPVPETIPWDDLTYLGMGEGLDGWDEEQSLWITPGPDYDARYVERYLHNPSGAEWWLVIHLVRLDGIAAEWLLTPTLVQRWYLAEHSASHSAETKADWSEAEARCVVTATTQWAGKGISYASSYGTNFEMPLPCEPWGTDGLSQGSYPSSSQTAVGTTGSHRWTRVGEMLYDLYWRSTYWGYSRWQARGIQVPRVSMDPGAAVTEDSIVGGVESLVPGAVGIWQGGRVETVLAARWRPKLSGRRTSTGQGCGLQARAVSVEDWQASVVTGGQAPPTGTLLGSVAIPAGEGQSEANPPPGDPYAFAIDLEVPVPLEPPAEGPDVVGILINTDLTESPAAVDVEMSPTSGSLIDPIASEPVDYGQNVDFRTTNELLLSGTLTGWAMVNPVYDCVP